MLFRVGEASLPGPPVKVGKCAGGKPLPGSSSSARPSRGTAISGRGDSLASIPCDDDGAPRDEGACMIDEGLNAGDKPLPGSSSPARPRQGTAISGRGDSPVSVPSDDDDAPSDQGASMLDELEFIPWTIGSARGHAMGVCNPSGVSGKFDIFKAFPEGFHGVAETQATAKIQRRFSSAIRGPKDSRGFFSTHGAAAPLRPGSAYAGGWTGVTQISSNPLRSAQISWPGQEFQSGRVSVAMSRLGGVHVLNTVVYLPPRGPTYPRARELGELLLEPISKEIVLSKGGLRAVMGDFNAAPGTLSAHKLWRQCGWVEVQEELFARFGVEPSPTCKGSSRPDQIWVCPELARLLTATAVVPIFPDHDLLLAKFHVPNDVAFERHWQMPTKLPWHAVDKPALEAKLDTLEAPSTSEDPTTELKRWARRVEACVRDTVTETFTFPNSCFGRCQVLQPRSRPVHHRIPKHSRAGDFVIEDSLLGRAAQLWFYQLRRFEHLHKCLVKGSGAAEAVLQRQLLWSSILRSKGFSKRFHSWWMTRPHPLQGSPCCLPIKIPDLASFVLIFEDYKGNYQKFIAWQRNKRQRVIQAKWEEAQSSFFKVTKRCARGPLESLIDVCEQRIEVVDASIQLIRVAHPFPEAGALKWTLEGVDAVVTPAADGYIVESDLLLIDGQRLSCKVLVDEIAVIHDRLLRLWNARWGKHLNVPDDHWHRIVSFAANFLPRGHCPLPAISFDVWIQAVKSFKTFAARGTDGIAREDLLSLPRKACLDLIEFFHRAEQGQGWPDQWLRAHIHCLAKKDDAEDVGSYRPITLFSLAYRVWAGIRAKQILSFLGLFRFEHQSGFLPHAMASDVWFFVQAEIETAYATGSQRCGLVADLVKAYNTIPRLPVKCFLNTVGAPEALTACWHDFLGGLKRCFVVRNSVSDSALSFTGYPEGCPLSCCAMVCLDIAWHAYQQKFAPVVQHFSFVDNLELVASDVRSLIRSFCVMEEFSRICDLEIDRPKLYSWATSSTNRRALEAGGFRIQLEARDLGGQANYSAKSFVKTITARIDGIQSCFSDLRKSTLDTWARVRCLSNALWPRALHGCESVRLGEGHFAKLRSGAMTACRWNRPGSSPWVRIALLKTEILDPEFFQLWRSLWLIRRQCSTNHKLRALWALFMTSALASKAQGPFSKLVHLLHDIGWSINEHFCVEVPYGFQFNLLECSEAELKCLAAYFWRQKAAKHVKGRRSLADLDGYEAAHAEQFDRSLSRSDCELLCIVRDGGHFTKDCISHFSSESGLCDLCQVEDSREHRFLTCPRYVGAREHFPDLASKWWALKDSLALHGLTSANPFKPLYWQALFALQNYEIEFRFPPPASDCWMIFTDGSGSNQQNKELALSAWAVISADEDDIVCSGWTPGLIQSVPRAETWALLAAVRWVSNEKGNAHIWIDNQGVVEVGRSLISGFDLPDEVENEDLWRQVELEVHHCGCNLWLHKTPSHLHPDDCCSELESWCAFFNDRADAAARWANANRPSWFEGIYRRFADRWHTDDETFRQISKVHLEIARTDTSFTSERKPELEPVDEFVVFRERSDCTNAFTLAQLDRIPGWFDLLQPQEVRHDLLKGLLDFVCGLEGEGGSTGWVSFIELAVGLRAFVGADLVSFGSRDSPNPWLQVTFASELQLLKKAWRILCRLLCIDFSVEWVDLTRVRIHSGCGAVRVAWPERVEISVLSVLDAFTRHRPIVNSQGLARPMGLA